MLKNRKLAAVLVTGALAVGLMGTAQADEPDPMAQTGQSGQTGEKDQVDQAETFTHRGNGKVISHRLNIRAHPNTHSKVLGSYHYGAIIKLRCKVSGQWVDGNRIWYRLADRPGYVTARYVKNLRPVNWCRR